MTVMPLVVMATWIVFTTVETPPTTPSSSSISPSNPSSSTPSPSSLPPEPDETTRIDEIYDQESRLFLSLYSLEGNGKVDYVTGRTVEQHVRSTYGNPVYYTLEFPIFYWWNHTMWNDPFVDGVNGNELVYQEDTDFDVSRYKPCVFNGQPC